MNRGVLLFAGLGLFLLGNASGFILGSTLAEGSDDAWGDPSTDDSSSSARQLDEPRVAGNPPSDSVEASDEAVSLDRPGYSLRHPPGWTIDTTDPAHDLDHHVAIDAPGACFVLFFVVDGLGDPEASVRQQTASLEEELVTDAQTSRFDRWGRYDGFGQVVVGKMLGVVNGQVRVFSHATPTRSFMVVEQCVDEELDRVRPGFEMIEASFQLR